ncbi:MAG TPA: phenylalanine--tRNA ligase subunit beta, partial [Thermoproteota archaeon]|nr:phenylalanine--tRNA ligase subunit beta [Thermoproteota archaeon]
RFSSLLCDLMIGLGFQQVMSYTLTNRANLFTKMKLKDEPVVELENPVSSSWSVFRNWILPCVVDFLSSNAHVDYPQNIFEIGDVVVPDQTKETRAVDRRKLACARASAEVGYQDMASVLDAFLSSLGCQYELRAISHPSFIEGRVANVVLNGANLGVLGEISPEVLEAWNIEIPVSAFEIDVSSLCDILPLENLN